MAKRKKFVAGGFSFDDSTGKFVEKDCNFLLADSSTVVGSGEFFTISAAQHIIRTYWEDLRGNSANRDIDDKIVAIEIGREILSMLLSQSTCDGIRIYHARGIEAVTTDNGVTNLSVRDKGLNTMVVVGIDANGNDLGVVESLVGITDEERKNIKNASIMAEHFQLTADKPDIMCSEVNPPNTFKSLALSADVEHEIEPLSLKKAFNEYINSVK